MPEEKSGGKRILTPNLKRLIFLRMGKDAIPDGGGFADGVKFLTTPGAIGEGFRKATEWVDAAVLAVRHATDPNPFRNASEEEICGEILRKLEEKKTVTQ